MILMPKQKKITIETLGAMTRDGFAAIDDKFAVIDEKFVAVHDEMGDIEKRLSDKIDSGFRAVLVAVHTTEYLDLRKRITVAEKDVRILKSKR